MKLKLSERCVNGFSVMKGVPLVLVNCEMCASGFSAVKLKGVSMVSVS